MPLTSHDAIMSKTPKRKTAVPYKTTAPSPAKETSSKKRLSANTGFGPQVPAAHAPRSGKDTGPAHGHTMADFTIHAGSRDLSISADAVRGVAQAKLQWTSSQLVQEAGSATLRSHVYKTLVLGLKRYHEFMAMLEAGNGNPAYEPNALTQLLDMARSWLDKNAGNTSAKVEARRAVINQVYADIARELGVVQSRKIMGAPGDKIGSGVVGSVVKTDYGQGTEAFKGDVPSHDSKAAMDSGIPANDPFLNHRAVAMSSVDEMLGTNSVTGTEFATLDDKGTPQQGISMEIAQGASPQKQAPFGPEGATDINGNPQTLDFMRNFNARDPEIVKQLSTLQVVDSIMGQVDRHVGNYFITTGGADGVQVKGIDNDFAAGAKNTDLDQRSEGSHLPGFPIYVDQAVADSIRTVGKNPDTLKKTLQSTLPPPEVDAVMQRFTQVLKKLDELAAMQPSHIISGADWGKDQIIDAHNADNSYSGFLREAQEQKGDNALLLPFDPNDTEPQRKDKERRFVEARIKVQGVMETEAYYNSKGKDGGLAAGEIPIGCGFAATSFPALKIEAEAAIQYLIQESPAVANAYVVAEARKKIAKAEIKAAELDKAQYDRLYEQLK